jgi:two-component system, OmpR family, phosphate regulon response regulator PhoB
MKKKKILFVEDEIDMRLFISTILTANGYDPVSAKNGTQGLTRAMDVKPDVILLDIMMPGEGGVFMYDRLKRTPELKTIPVCILSGVDKPAFLHFLKMTGANRRKSLPEPDAYLEKPFEPVDLVDILKRILPADG